MDADQHPLVTHSHKDNELQPQHLRKTKKIKKSSGFFRLSMQHLKKKYTKKEKRVSLSFILSNHLFSFERKETSLVANGVSAITQLNADVYTVHREETTFFVPITQTDKETTGKTCFD